MGTPGQNLSGFGQRNSRCPAWPVCDSAGYRASSHSILRISFATLASRQLTRQPLYSAGMRRVNLEVIYGGANPQRMREVPLLALPHYLYARSENPFNQRQSKKLVLLMSSLNLHSMKWTGVT